MKEWKSLGVSGDSFGSGGAAAPGVTSTRAGSADLIKDGNREPERARRICLSYGLHEDC